MDSHIKVYFMTANHKLSLFKKSFKVGAFVKETIFSV